MGSRPGEGLELGFESEERVRQQVLGFGQEELMRQRAVELGLGSGT